MKKTDNFYDKIYRYMFKQSVFIKALVKFAFPAELYQGINWTTLKGEKTHFVSKNLKSREADAIYEVELKNKEKLYLYFIIEFQSTIDKFMPLRLYIYIAMFYNELLSKNRIGDEVPIVLPLVLYTGDRPWNGATQLSKLMDEDIYKIVKKYVPELEYMLIDKNRYSVTDLRQMRDAISGILYLEKMDGTKIVETIMDFQDIFLKGLQLDDRVIMNEYLQALFKHKFNKIIPNKILDSEEVPEMLLTAINEWEERIWQEGMQEGILDTALRMLEKDLPIDIIAEVTGLSDDEIKKLQENRKV